MQGIVDEQDWEEREGFLRDGLKFGFFSQVLWKNALVSK